MINIEQKLRMDEGRLAAGTTVEMKSAPDVTVPR